MMIDKNKRKRTSKEKQTSGFKEIRLHFATNEMCAAVLKNELSVQIEFTFSDNYLAATESGESYLCDDIVAELTAVFAAYPINKMSDLGKIIKSFQSRKQLKKTLRVIDGKKTN